MDEKVRKVYQEKIQRVEDAIALKEPDHVPICPCVGIVPYALDGCTRDLTAERPMSWRDLQ